MKLLIITLAYIGYSFFLSVLGFASFVIFKSFQHDYLESEKKVIENRLKLDTDSLIFFYVQRRDTILLKEQLNIISQRDEKHNMEGTIIVRTNIHSKRNSHSLKSEIEKGYSFDSDTLRYEKKINLEKIEYYQKDSALRAKQLDTLKTKISINEFTSRFWEKF